MEPHKKSLWFPRNAPEGRTSRTRGPIHPRAEPVVLLVRDKSAIYESILDDHRHKFKIKRIPGHGKKIGTEINSNPDVREKNRMIWKRRNTNQAGAKAEENRELIPPLFPLLS